MQFLTPTILKKIYIWTQWNLNLHTKLPGRKKFWCACIAAPRQVCGKCRKNGTSSSTIYNRKYWAATAAQQDQQQAVRPNGNSSINLVLTGGRWYYNFLCREQILFITWKDNVVLLDEKLITITWSKEHRTCRYLVQIKDIVCSIFLGTIKDSYENIYVNIHA